MRTSYVYRNGRRLDGIRVHRVFGDRLHLGIYEMTCFGLAMLGTLTVFGLRWLVGWMTYINNRD